MRNSNYIALICFLSLVSFGVKGQILNVDRENGEDTIQKKFRCSITLSFSSDKQKKNLVDVGSTNELDFFLSKNHLLVALAQTEMTFNGSQAIENNGFVQIRLRDNDSRKLYPDYFTQYQWNGVQGMEYRFLGGVNLRARFLEAKKSDLYASIGVFYESEKWNPNLSSYAFSTDSISSVFRNLMRLNVSSKYAFKFGEKIDLSGSTFVQFPFNNYFLSPRWFIDCNLNFDVTKHFAFVIHYDHNFDVYRPLPIDKYYYSLTLGAKFHL